MEDRPTTKPYLQQSELTEVNITEQTSCTSNPEVRQIVDSVKVLQASEGQHFQLLKDGIADTFRAVADTKTTIIEESKSTQGQLAEIQDVTTTCIRKVQLNARSLADNEDVLTKVGTQVGQLKVKIHQVADDVSSQTEIVNRTMESRLQKVSDQQMDIRDDI